MRGNRIVMGGAGCDRSPRVEALARVQRLRRIEGPTTDRGAAIDTTRRAVAAPCAARKVWLQSPGARPGRRLDRGIARIGPAASGNPGAR